MSEIRRIVEQMEAIHAGDSWAGANLADSVKGLTWEQAAAHPVPESHSIWEITLHLITTQLYIVDLCRGISRPFEPGDEWPAIEVKNQQAWDDTVERFLAGEAETRTVVAGELEIDALDAPFRKGGSSVYSTLHGYIHHALYHGGQISMLRRLVKP